MRIDLNCDMGESFGAWKMGNDEEMMAFISSANVAGGFHAGDPHVMRKTVDLAKQRGVTVGIHSGYGDLVGFGRRELDVTPQEIRDELIYQLGALREFTRLRDMEVQHVKPHGALYMAAARDEDLSRAIVQAIQEADPRLLLYCMQSSVTYEVAEEMGQPVAREFFADRGYGDDGQIIFTRNVADKLDPVAVGDRVVRAVTEGRVESESGGDIEMTADSVCVHGDTPGAVELAEAIAKRLRESGVEIEPPGRAGEKTS